jgi:hypothetical protein
MTANEPLIFCVRAEDERRLVHTVAKVSETTFAAGWANDEDAAYDRL